MIKQIDKFEKNNHDIAVNVLFNNKKNQNKHIYTVRRSGHNGKSKKQVNLFMIVDGEKRHYTAIKYIQAFIKVKRKNPTRISLLDEMVERFSYRVRKRQAL